MSRPERSFLRDLVALWPVSLIGLIGVLVPVRLFGSANQDPFDGPFGVITLAALIAAGTIAGVVARGRPVLGGLASVALLPVATLIAVVLDPTSHNLWPLEIVLHLLLALPAIGAAALTSAVLRWIPGRA
jgi:hypothetical protein